jgi:hypothetical protein
MRTAAVLLGQNVLLGRQRQQVLDQRGDEDGFAGAMEPAHREPDHVLIDRTIEHGASTSGKAAKTHRAAFLFANRIFVPA